MFVYYRVVLDRCYSPPWDLEPGDPLNDLSTHFAPVAAPFDEESLESLSPPPVRDSVISIRFDSDDKDEIVDPSAIESAGLDCIRVPPASLSPPLVGHSDVNVIEEPVDRSEVDWWNYFETVDEDCPLDVVDRTTQHDEAPVVVSKASSPIAPDSSFWRPKSSAIPNSDWYYSSCSLVDPV